jgi:hypothetical protein
MDYLDSKKGCEAKVIRFDWLMISLRTSCVSYADTCSSLVILIHVVHW